MKKIVSVLLVGVIFILLAVSSSISGVYASENANRIEFLYNNNVFVYNLDKNKKTNTQFDINYELNKYNRFGSEADRINLLKHMLAVGFEEKIAVQYLFPNLNKTVEKIKKNVQIAPKNASLSINSNSANVFNIKNEVIGVVVDEVELYSQICEKFITGKALTINLPIKKIKPEVLTADFKKFANLRSDFSTNFASSNADRKHNIKNALNALNKVEILPNKVFSFNQTVGRRTVENGYRQAKIIVNDEFVDGLGGGVCQVSTTLYNSALLAGLEILEANKHSKQVGYVKYGFDAMVNFGSSDLKFRNNTSEKLTIITNYTPTSARIRIYGEEMQESYKLTNEIVSTTEPVEEVKYDTNLEYLNKVQYEDEFFYLKRATKGMEIKSYREKYVNGKAVEKELLRFDKYKAQNSIKVYGTKPRAVTELLPILSH